MGGGQSTKFLGSSSNTGTNKSSSTTKASKDLGIALEKLEREKRELQDEVKRLGSENEQL